MIKIKSSYIKPSNGNLPNLSITESEKAVEELQTFHDLVINDQIKSPHTSSDISSELSEHIDESKHVISDKLSMELPHEKDVGFTDIISDELPTERPQAIDDISAAISNSLDEVTDIIIDELPIETAEVSESLDKCIDVILDEKSDKISMGDKMNLLINVLMIWS